MGKVSTCCVTGVASQPINSLWPGDIIGVGQHWFRLWLVTGQHWFRLWLVTGQHWFRLWLVTGQHWFRLWLVTGQHWFRLWLVTGQHRFRLWLVTGQHWFRLWLVTYSTPVHHFSQYWLLASVEQILHWLMGLTILPCTRHGCIWQLKLPAYLHYHRKQACSLTLQLSVLHKCIWLPAQWALQLPWWSLAECSNALMY